MSVTNNPFMQQGGVQASGAKGLANRFEDLAKPEEKPKIIKGKTT